MQPFNTNLRVLRLFGEKSAGKPMSITMSRKTLNQKRTVHLLFAILVCYSGLLSAEPVRSHRTIVSEKTAFIVSGILRSGTDGIVLKLVHSHVAANSAEEALGSFTRNVLAKYPGYSLMDTLVTPVPASTTPCALSI